MSHVAKIELEITDLQDLKNASQRLGLKFCENQKTYKWYGRYVGDNPLPEGISQEDLGKCHHAIKVQGAAYEIGVVKIQNKFILLWDSWRSGKLENHLGKDAGLLKQAYAAERIRSEARRKNYQVCEQKTEKNIRLVLTV